MADRLIPVKWDSLVNRLRTLGFKGPYLGGKHYFMTRNEIRLTIPNPHAGDIGVPLLKEILFQGNTSREEWLKTK